MVSSQVFDRSKGRRTAGAWTICELHRLIYDLLVLNMQDRPEVLRQVVALLEKAYTTGVKMNLKMVESKASLSLKEWGVQSTEERAKAKRLRGLRVALTEELARVEKDRLSC